MMELFYQYGIKSFFLLVWERGRVVFQWLYDKRYLNQEITFMLRIWFPSYTEKKTSIKPKPK